MTPDGLSAAVEPCDAIYVDESEAAAEEAEERARQQHEEVRAVLDAAPLAYPYCHCGTVAIRRCTRCHSPVCNSDGACSFWREERWYCGPCRRIHDDEVRVREEADRERRKALYRALPALTVDELAAYLRDQSVEIQDGVTHRLDGVTGRMIADAFAVNNEDRVVMRWPSSSGPRRVLNPSGAIFSEETETVYSAGPNDSTIRDRRTTARLVAKPNAVYEFDGGVPSELRQLTVPPARATENSAAAPAATRTAPPRSPKRLRKELSIPILPLIVGIVLLLFVLAVAASL